ncbi:alpha/beta hydrolase [Zunongwangia endophytica]|uniref:Alpha/beta hydrolase n=1 Tax=Zunongwangia endophytica TaxID=1808945 RepID=A0ABV8H878_9FLAO|nr:alpha/beta hydrolase family protein [Zunongwangia endophytica]MDN3595952.1 alpha/beta hydrolase family protein [Zunongwangia endophytica]
MKNWLLGFSALIIFSTKTIAQQIDTLEVFSKSMQKQVKTIVITPSEEENLPTVYVLHGYSGYPERTLKKDIPSLIELSLRYNMNFILPDGNYDSWYIDSPIKNSKYETFITTELVEFIDNRYHTQHSKKAIMGWSMGGHGALYLGARHPEIFLAIGSISGAINMIPYGQNYGVPKILGANKNNWKTYTASSQLENFKSSSQKIIISCGYDDVLIEQNRKLHKKLIELNIPHFYIESPGKHDAAYWSEAAKNQLFLIDNIFKSNE